MRTECIKVVHIGTAISHSSAPLRIHKAVKKAGVESCILTFQKSIENEDVHLAKKNLKYKIWNKFMFYYEKKQLGKYSKENLPFSFGAMGIDLSQNEFVKNADIIHLHWINGQFLSYYNIKQLAKLKKPIVWTFHDSWPMTGGCHVRYGCEGFKKNCGCCPELNSLNPKDITAKIMRQKREIYPTDKIITVAPSKWMHDNINESSLFGKCYNVQIGNPLDLEIFSGKDGNGKDEKIRILFGASGALELEYKGYQYFAKAMEYLYKTQKELAAKIEINIFGTEIKEFPGLENYECKALGYIKSEEKMAEMYRNADIYVFPSLDDNLPGTVMESLACETPVVAFQTGGVPELVQHKINGYVAKYKDSVDLADGIVWVKENRNEMKLGKKAREHIEMRYNEEIIGKNYVDLYKGSLKVNERRKI